MRKVKQEMVDEKDKKQKGQGQPQGQSKPQGKKAKPEQVEAAAEETSGKPARPKANNPATARMREKYVKEVLPALKKLFAREGIGLIPLVVGGKKPGLEILYPVATVILGGLVTSTFCEFLIHPGLFWRFSGKDAERLADLADRESVLGPAGDPGQTLIGP